MFFSIGYTYMDGEEEMVGGIYVDVKDREEALHVASTIFESEDVVGVSDVSGDISISDGDVDSKYICSCGKIHQCLLNNSGICKGRSKVYCKNLVAVPLKENI